jgi:hypothetical protein
LWIAAETLPTNKGIKFPDEFLKRGGVLSREDSQMFLQKLGSLVKARKPPRLRVIAPTASQPRIQQCRVDQRCSVDLAG